MIWLYKEMGIAAGFKMAVTKEVAKSTHDVFDETKKGEFNEADEVHFIVQKALANNVQALKETASIMEINELEKAIHYTFYTVTNYKDIRCCSVDWRKRNSASGWIDVCKDCAIICD